MSRRVASTAAVSLALYLILDSAFAQVPVPLGAEFLVNTATKYSQFATRGFVAHEDNGDFVVVWVSQNQDGSEYGVFGQRYSSSGAALGLEFQVNTVTAGTQTFPVVASDADGDFVVAWASYNDGYSVSARRFASSGAALDAEFQVNAYSTGSTSSPSPSVARDADGDFVVAWQIIGQDGSGFGVFARRFNAAGAAQGTELLVNTITLLDQTRPEVDLDADGDFVIAWETPDSNVSGVFAQRFSSAGGKQSSEFQVNVYTVNNQTTPDVGLDADGDFVVAWRSYSQDGSSGGVFSRRFNSSGSALGSEMQVNTFVTGDQGPPSIAVDSTGDFVVAWDSATQEGSSGIFARHFRSSGLAIGEIHVNSTTMADQQDPAVSADADGDFVVAWSSFEQDGSGYAVIGQRFDIPMVLDIDGNGELTALTDGLLVMRFLFGLTGATLTAGAVGPSCARCDSTTILPYLQSLT